MPRLEVKSSTTAGNTARGIRYDRDFFSAHRSARALSSADAVVPLLIDMLAPASVLDVGCGSGEWLFAMTRHGVQDIHGIDKYAAESGALMIGREHVSALDVEAPFSLGRRFDLVLCLEVAEHLAPDAAAVFIASLTDHGDAVAFSAALPGQGGHGHINEQWLEYWVELFQHRGYRGFDVLRPRLWRNADVAYYYRQNLVLFVNEQARPVLERVAQWDTDMHQPLLSLVHPDTLLYHAGLNDASRGLRYAVRALYLAVVHRLGLRRVAPQPLPPYPPAPEASRTPP